MQSAISFMYGHTSHENGPGNDVIPSGNMRFFSAHSDTVMWLMSVCMQDARALFSHCAISFFSAALYISGICKPLRYCLLHGFGHCGTYLLFKVRFNGF